MGRKKLGEQAKSAYLRVRMAPADLDEIKDAAGKESVSDWSRHVLLKAARKARKRK